MGLIKDSIGAALGTNQPRNGFNGPQIPFINGNKNINVRQGQNQTSQKYEYPIQGQNQISQRYDYSNQNLPLQRYDYPNQNLSPQMTNGSRESNDRRRRNRSSRRSDDRASRRLDGKHSQRSSYPDSSPPSYMTSQSQWHDNYHNTGISDSYDTYNNDNHQDRGFDGSRFRPFAIPQCMYGEGQPFLRAYSEELASRGISEHDFIKVVDQLNVAVIPNPEAQIVGKSAKIAGHFVPGVEHIALLGTRVAVGIASSVGHASLLNRSLSKANLELFLPQGLELCIGTSQDLDNEVGVQTSVSSATISSGRPQDRLPQYGRTIAPITVVLQPLSNIGRQDPIAAVGRALGQRDTDRQNKRVQKDLAKGKSRKIAKLDDECVWLIVREARPETLSYWRKNLQESEAALQKEQEVAAQQSWR